MTADSWWPTDYFASRQQFVDLAEACGAQTSSHAIQATGPQNETLFVDVAALTSAHDEHLIVLVSGLHGVEGFIGASTQAQILSTLLQQGKPDSIGIVMIHAANPWGFAHLRRVNEDNIDANRNFLRLSSQQPTTHARYASLDPLINPRHAPGFGDDIRFWLRASELIVRDRGIGKLFKPIAEGQYDFPKGLFYGGKDTSQSCRLLQNIITNHAKVVSSVSILDVHSGLGPSGTATLIGNCNRVIREKRQDWLTSHYRQPVHIDGQEGNAYNASNTFSQWCQHNLGDKRFLYLCVEIGTVNPLKLFSALRKENQAHHWAQTKSNLLEQSKQALLAVFAPPCPDWRAKSTAQALDVFARTMELIRSSNQ